MAELEGLRQSKVDCTKHKEKYKGRMKTDSADRSKIQDALVTIIIHSLKPETHAENILANIYSAEEVKSDVKVNNSLETGAKEMIRFQESLPDGFKTTLKTQIVTMSTTKKKSHYTEDYVVMNYNTNLRVFYYIQL